MSDQPTSPPLPTTEPLPGAETTGAEPEELRLSFSKVDTYQQCPLKYKFQAVDKLPTPPAPELSWGTSLHAALEWFWDRKLPEPSSADDLAEALYDRWDDTGFADMPREEKIRWYRYAQDVLRRHHAQHAAAFRPAAAVEQWFDVDLGARVRVRGFIDAAMPTEGGGFGIVDWKTNRKAKPREHVEGSLQLALYALAARELWGRDPDWVAFEFVVPGMRVDVPIERIDVDAAVAEVHRVAEQIRAERFEPTPNRLCPWCDFRGLCPAFEGDDGGADVPGTALIELRTLKRRQARDAERIAELEEIVRASFGDEALVEVG
jgi:RecB family exonuclease